ncbi:MAG: hypothetical protein AABZ80_06940 [Gemmatimonadota bacterium]
MRTALVLLAFATVVSPLDAQAPKGKKPQDRILAWELESYGGASMQEVIATARPRFLMPTPTNRDAGARTEWRVLVYIGTHAIGDTVVLGSYKASEVKEVRHFRPNEASARFGSDNAAVILLTLKDQKP